MVHGIPTPAHTWTASIATKAIRKLTAAATAVEMALQNVGESRSFKIETHRSDRSFPLQSPEINRLVGTEVQAAIE